VARTDMAGHKVTQWGMRKALDLAAYEAGPSLVCVHQQREA